jgi:hypothetical protein
MSPRPKIALIDPIRTARALIGELERRRLDYVIVDSGLVGSAPSPPPAIEDVAARLRRERVTYVMGCVDPSLVYADRLSALMGLPSNGLRLSAARRDKRQMNDVVRRAGLRAPASFETDDCDALLRWVREVRLPVVLKPVASGGSDNVRRCDSPTEVAIAFDEILGRKNLMGVINRSVLAQEYVDGEEYAVDCVTFDGVHVLVDVFAYQKGTHNGRAFVYEKETYLRSEDPITARLRPFAYRVLDALEFRTGASHMEVKIDSKGELVFIEVGARMNGGDTYKQVQDCRADGKSQLELSVDAALGMSPPDPEHYPSIKGCVRVYVVSHEEGVLKELRGRDEIKKLRSYFDMHIAIAPGQRLTPTTDLTNPAGWIDLSNADARALENDERRLDEILGPAPLVLE